MKTLFVPQEDFFFHLLTDHLNDRVRDRLIEVIELELGNSKHDINRPQTLSKLIRNAQNNCDFVKNSRDVSFKFDYERQEAFLLGSSWYTLIRYYNSSDPGYELSVCSDYVLDVEYVLSDYRIEYLDYADDYIEKFELLNSGLIEEVVNYIKCDFYQDMLKRGNEAN